MAILTKVSAVNVIGIPFGIDPVLAPQQMFEQNQVSQDTKRMDFKDAQ